MAKDKKEQEPEPTLRERYLDIDLFAGPDMVYEMSDARGEKREYTIPEDVPFPLALAFLDRFDAWSEAQQKAMRARHPKQQTDAKHQYTEAWGAMLQALLSLVQLRQPEETVDGLNGIGQNALATWIVTICNNLDPTRYLKAFEEILKAIPKVPSKQPEESPPASSE